MAEEILFCHIGPRQASSCCQLGAPGRGVVAVVCGVARTVCRIAQKLQFRFDGLSRVGG